MICYLLCLQDDVEKFVCIKKSCAGCLKKSDVHEATTWLKFFCVYFVLYCISFGW